MSELERGRPRIIHLADYANRHPGSFAPMLAAAFEASRERGWRTEAVLDKRTAGAGWVGELRSAGATIHFAPAVGRVALSRYVRGLVGQEDSPAILHTHFTRFDIPAVIGAAGRPDVSVVWHEHTYLKRRPLVLVRNVLRIAAFGRGADLVLCAAPETATAMRARGAPRDRVEYFPNGIDPERFVPAGPGDKAAARAEFGLPGDARILLHFGWSWELKGGELFLEALSRLKTRFPDVYGVVVIGTEETLPATRKLGLEDRVKVVPATDRIQRLIQASDGVMALSRVEGGTPFAVLESLSSGVAVIASDISGHRAIGPHLEACRLVPREAGAVTEAAASVLGRSEAEAEAEGQAARRHIEAEFSLERWSSTLMSRYESLPGSGAPRVARRGRATVSGGQAPTVIQLCDFRRKEGGSFIPSITSTLVAAREAGWGAKAVFIKPPGPIDWESDFSDLGLDVQFVRAGSRANLGNWLSREVSSQGPTVLHSHFTTWDVPASLAALRKRSAVPIWHVHSTLPETAYSRLRNVAKFASIGRGVGAILCPSQNIIDGVLRRGGPRGRVLLWPSAIDTERLPLLSDEDRRRARAELGLPEGKPVVLHFGWHWHLKGGDVFLEALRELVDSGLDDVVGLERGGEETKFSEYAANLGVSGHLVQVPPVPEIGVLFGASDVLLTTSRSEGMAYSVVESLASGTPVVATPIPGHTILGENVDACRIATHEPGDLAQGVLDTLGRGPGEVEAERVQARDWIDEHLSLRSNAGRLIELYREALAGQELTHPAIG